MTAKSNPIAIVAAVVAMAAGVRVAAESGAVPAAPYSVEQSAEASQLAVVTERSMLLSAAFPELAAAQGRTFRARKIVIAPGARTPEVDGGLRPSIFFVTRGAVVEHRSDQPAPVAHALHAAGSVSKGVTHWVENTADAPAEILVMDIVPSSEQ